MRKFIEFFQKFRVFLVFMLLQIAALTSYFSVMSYPRTKFFNTSNAVVSTLLNWEREIDKYLFLDDANKELLENNVKLQQQLSKNYIVVDDRTSKINDTLHETSHQLMPATVINSSHNFSNNYFTIEAGSLRGVEPKMGVTTEKGIVGYVYDVSKRYAVVKSILTEDINISAYIEGTKAHGLIKYLHYNPKYVSLIGVSNDIPIEIGQHVKARGSGGYFPKGEPIGTVKKIESIEGKPMWEITVELHQDMRRLHYVQVIKNIHQLELDSLQMKYRELK